METSDQEYDPKEENSRLRIIIHRAEKQAEKNMADYPRGLGFCHRLWEKQKRILKEQYEIDWKTPAEMNQDVLYD